MTYRTQHLDNTNLLNWVISHAPLLSTLDSNYETKPKYKLQRKNKTNPNLIPYITYFNTLLVFRSRKTKRSQNIIANPDGFRDEGPMVQYSFNENAKQSQFPRFPSKIKGTQKNKPKIERSKIRLWQTNPNYKTNPNRIPVRAGTLAVYSAVLAAEKQAVPAKTNPNILIFKQKMDFAKKTNPFFYKTLICVICEICGFVLCKTKPIFRRLPREIILFIAFFGLEDRIWGNKL